MSVRVRLQPSRPTIRRATRARCSRLVSDSTAELPCRARRPLARAGRERTRRPPQGAAVIERLERDFLAAGGFVTTRIASGQQWDAPNGWPPLQWLCIEAARRYSRADVASTVRERWLALERKTFRATGRMMEKYDVLDPSRPAGGGEYPTQDGFGWTPGVTLALIAQEAGSPDRREPPDVPARRATKAIR
jgi:hypothetical protein